MHNTEKLFKDGHNLIFTFTLYFVLLICKSKTYSLSLADQNSWYFYML
jgi:hypothetical protein